MIWYMEIKKWVDDQYADGRVTVLTDEELVKVINEICEEKHITIGKSRKMLALQTDGSKHWVSMM